MMGRLNFPDPMKNNRILIKFEDMVNVYLSINIHLCTGLRVQCSN